MAENYKSKTFGAATADSTTSLAAAQTVSGAAVMTLDATKKVLPICCFHMGFKSYPPLIQEHRSIES